MKAPQNGYTDKFYDWCIDSHNIQDIIKLLYIIIPLGIGLISTDSSFGTSITTFLNNFPSVFHLKLNGLFIIFIILVVILILISFINDGIKNRKVEHVKAQINFDTDKHVTKVIDRLESSSQNMVTLWHNEVSQLQENLTTATTTLNSAIHFAPNPKIFAKYTVIYEFIRNKVSEHKATKKTIANVEDGDLHYKKMFHEILSAVCQLTKQYRNDHDSEFCANIMVYYSELKEPKRFKNIRQSKAYLGADYPGEVFVTAFLEGLPELIYSTSNERYSMPLITLPIFTTLEDENSLFYFPGACEVLNDVKTEANVINRTKDFENPELINSFHPLIQTSLALFFKDMAKGTIGSSVSIDIPVINPETGNNIPLIGVLNIDSNREFILGEVIEYNSTFYSLLVPIASQISFLLDDYLLYLNNYH